MTVRDDALLPDVLESGLRIVFCGTALGARSAEVGAYYAGSGNSFWPTLHAVGLTPRVLMPSEYRELTQYGIGLTDICKTRSGSDQDVGTDGFDVPRLAGQIRRGAPRWLAFNGKNAALAALGRKKVDYGRQSEKFAGAEVFVLPSTSGAARGYWDVEYWADLARLSS